MTITRRTLAKGAAWSAPVILASATIPAYAASKVEYKPTYSIGASYTYSGSVNTLKLGSNTRRSLPFPDGLGVRYETGASKTLEATLTALKVVYAFPKGWVTGLKLTSGSYSQPQKVVGAAYGISDRDYDIFEVVFAAPAKGMTQPSTVAERQAFPGTAFTMEATSFGRVISAPTVPAYMGYVGAFTTADGFNTSFNFVNYIPLQGTTAPRTLAKTASTETFTASAVNYA
ncbi:hypothetical protein [uncultured Rothia sp.]|uniref:hypothetical protein n=1 Tax=uncultured Rothia sp. TaxID=316088 RepID=UPI0032169B38